MANKVWVGNAHATKQIDTITVAGTWAAADTCTLTINTKDIIITIGNGTTTAQVAESIRDAWNATTRLDGTGTNTNTSNVGGQEFGEFTEAQAVIYLTSTSVVRIIGNKAGNPFTLTVTEATVGDGTAAEATAQAATGANHWDNADNWILDTGSAATVPTTDDVLTFKDSNVSVKYGLPTSLNVTIIQYQSFTGQIGLSDTNMDNASKPYREYRQRNVRLDDTGATDDTLTHVFGLGEGTGSPLIRIRHQNAAATPNGLTVSAVVYNTGTPQVQGTKALMLLINNDGLAGGTVTVLKGSVYLGNQSDSSVLPTYTTAFIGFTGSQQSDSDVVIENHATNVTINQSGGTLLVSERAGTATAGTRTLNISGGTCTVRDLITSGAVTATLLNCTFTYNTTKTITALVVGTGATFDLEKDGRAVTITTCDLFEGASLLDEYARGTYTAGIDLNRCGIDDVTLRVGNNRRLTLGAAA